MNAPIHPTSQAPIETAAGWLATQPAPVPHVIPTLKDRFGLTALECCKAIALARDMPTPADRKEGSR